MATSSTVLLTGFEPFDGERTNPSQEIVRALDGRVIGGHRVVGAVLPVAFAATLPMLEDLIDAHQPVLALALGQAGGRSGISLERIAINLIDARIADNEGLQPCDEAVVAGAPAAYLTGLPVKALQAHLCALGIPAEVSLSAGSFVCNQVFFALAHMTATRHRPARSGFVHVPWLPEQAAMRPGEPSMALATMIAGVDAAIQCALATRHERRVAGGATH